MLRENLPDILLGEELWTFICAQKTLISDTKQMCKRIRQKVFSRLTGIYGVFRGFGTYIVQKYPRN
jgi:hypothetical protein